MLFVQNPISYNQIEIFIDLQMIIILKFWNVNED